MASFLSVRAIFACLYSSAKPVILQNSAYAKKVVSKTRFIYFYDKCDQNAETGSLCTNTIMYLHAKHTSAYVHITYLRTCIKQLLHHRDTRTHTHVHTHSHTRMQTQEDAHVRRSCPPVVQSQCDECLTSEVNRNAFWNRGVT
jgi:hypothetical protein